MEISRIASQASVAAPPLVTARRIMVVDDSAVQRRLLSTILRRRGYEVVEAESGHAALRTMHDHGADIIISDWMMPGMSGPELCEELRGLGRDNYAYFILLSSKSDRADITQGLERGADDFLTKPVSAAELSARLKAGERILAMQNEMAEKNAELSQMLVRLNAAQKAMDRDLENARHLQQSLVPETQRFFAGGTVSLLLHPSGAVGGDLVGSFRISETRLGFFAVDVAGHGIASALMAARIAGYLNSSSPDQNIAIMIDEMGLYSMRPPPEVCEHLNRIVLEDMTTDFYFTMVIGECDLRTGEVELTQAGHPPPMVQRASGVVEFAGEGGLPIGLISDAVFDSFKVKLDPGDRLLLYSDGVTECEDAAGEQLGQEGLATFSKTSRGLSGTDYLDALVERLTSFSSPADFPDDVSATLFEFRGL